MDLAEQLVAAQRESCRTTCPKCSHTRKKQKDRCLSITVEPAETLYDCHHCGWSGKLTTIRPIKMTRPQKIAPIPTQLNQDSEIIKSFFAARGIETDDLSQLPPMTTGEKYFARLKDKAMAVGFVYGDPADPDAIKWRPADGRKDFTQDASDRTVGFWGIDKISDETTVICCEGEADLVALASIGIKAVSVPNGAPQKISNKRIDPSEDKKFSYIWEAKDILERAEKIVLAIDNDEAGDALVEEIARRCDRAKCWRVRFPKDCKDPTDVIVKHGADAMRECLDMADPMPLDGVYSADNYSAELLDIYNNGYGGGESTGYQTVDKLFTVKGGMMYIVTGIPGSGKSEFVDQVMMNLATGRSWKFAVASFENPPATHIAKLAEKYIGKPFMDGPTPRMSDGELKKAVGFIDDHFVFLENKDGSMSSIESIINRAKQAVMRLGVRGLVIDPYNYINIGNVEFEHSSISKMLSQVGAFAKAHDIAVFFVAHPTKLRRKDDGTYPIPRGMDVSGSSAWFSKADVGITVHRIDRGAEIHCWKVRFKWLGAQGETPLDYDVPTGRYFEPIHNYKRSTDKTWMGDWQ